ncbi:MAG: PLP-dependent aminotransferase family protein [Chloroflexota bacterium]
MSFAHLLEIDRQRGQSLYRQIAEQIKLQISDGRLPAGTQLPTVRQLAHSLNVTRATAQSAYGELQSGGWVESTVGRGTFVIAAPQNEDIITAVMGNQLTPDRLMGNMQRIGRIVGLRSLAYAEPDPALFPTEEFWSSLMAQAHDATDLFQYSAPQGDEMLRVELSVMLGERGIAALPDEVLVTSGATQALAVVTQTLAARGDYVAVEQPVYLGLLHILGTHGARPIGVPLDSEGVRLDCLEQVIVQHHPKFLYTTPNFQNPTGTGMSAQRRTDLLALAARYRLTIVEDDVYGQLHYGDTPASPLKAHDTEDLVVYVNAASKVLMPGLRIGYIVAPFAMQDRMISIRQANDLAGAPLLQRAFANFLHRGRLKIHLRRVLPHYRERRDALLQALQYAMPHGVEWTRPEGGFCCWITLPDDQMSSDLYHEALQHGVAFTPGDAFLIKPDGHYHLRLCFGSSTPEAIHEGVNRLGELLRERTTVRFRGRARDLPLV